MAYFVSIHVYSLFLGHAKVTEPGELSTWWGYIFNSWLTQSLLLILKFKPFLASKLPKGISQRNGLGLNILQYSRFLSQYLDRS